MSYLKVLLDRWQFGVTITYHFLFVPLTIGLAFLVAIMQVLAYRRRDEVWERLTRFFGTVVRMSVPRAALTGHERDRAARPGCWLSLSPRAYWYSASVPFNPGGEIRLPVLLFLVTNAQVQALEQQRTGDLRLELQVNAVLPQASAGYPGATPVTEYITIAESRWRQQLAGLGRTLGAEMLIAFPNDDEVRLAVGGFLREAQRLLGGTEIDSAMLQVRKALETIKNTGSWPWPGGKKDKGQITADERWALIRAAMEDQASGAMHVDPGTKDYTYTRAQVEALIAMTAALLNVVPRLHRSRVTAAARRSAGPSWRGRRSTEHATPRPGRFPHRCRCTGNS